MSALPKLVLADAAFTVGQSHLDNAKPCQDYALAQGQEFLGEPGLGWAAISDGCSSAGLTDIGARMWVHAVRQLLSQEPTSWLLFGEPAQLKQKVLEKGQALMRPFEQADALATLGVVCSNGTQAHAVLFGDGVVASRDNKGVTSVWSVTYEANAPRYLAYEFTREGGHCGLPRWQALVVDSLVHITKQVFDASGQCVGRTVQSKSAVDHEGLVLSWPEVQDLELLAVTSDGVSSFEGLDEYRALAQLLAVKNPAGQFFHRRLGALARSWKKGISPMPQDDLSAGLLWFKTVGSPS